MRLLAVLLVLSCVGVAHADEDHYLAGRKAYDLRDFDQAIDEWKKGFTQTNDPAFLYNIGSAYREKHDYERAIFYYNRFLHEAPNAAKADQIRARIEEMKGALNNPPKDPQAPGEKSGPATTPPPQEKPVPTPAETARAAEQARPPEDAATRPDPGAGRGLRIGGIVTTGAGVALLVTGALFTLAAGSAASDLQTARDQHQPWSQDLADLQSSGQRDQVVAGVCYGVGAAAVVTGAVMTYLGVQKGRVSVETAAAPHTFGMALKVGF